MMQEISLLVTGGVGGIAVFLMKRIAAKIEERLDRVEDHEKRLSVVEERCKIFHGEEG